MKTISAPLLTLAIGVLVSGAASGAVRTSPYRPRLVVSNFGAFKPSETHFATYVARGSLRTAEVDLYIGAGYTATLGQLPGTRVGTITASAEDRGLTAPFGPGTITVADPATFANASCDSAHHDAVWLATLRSSSRTFTFPIYVRAELNQSTEFHWCFAPTDPSLVSLSFDLEGLLRQPRSGSHTWDARFTPYDPTTAAEISGAQVSSLVAVRLPQRVALHVSYSKKRGTYRLTGEATEDGRGTRGIVRIFRSVAGGPFITNRAIGCSPTLTGNGAFGCAGRLSTKKTVRFRAHFTALPFESVHCGKDLNGVPCVSASDGGWEKDSPIAAIQS